MRPNPFPTACAVLALTAGLALAGCDKLNPNGTPSTIVMLRAGSEQACVAAEVQDDLRGLILPKPGDLGSDVAPQDAQNAIGIAALSFNATTLQSTDKAVAKVSCTTNVQLSGLNGDTTKFRVDYEVSPSADDPNHVVVSADTADARAYARLQIDNAVAHQNAVKAQTQAANQAAQAQQQLLALISPRWLTGLWIPTDADAGACSNGLAYAFRANHRVEGSSLNGRWVLTQDHLHAIGQGMNGATEIDGTITAADPLSFTLTLADTTTRSMRRCSRDEINAGNLPTATSPTGLPDSFAPAQPAQPSPN